MDYTQLSEKELNARVEKDENGALFEKGRRHFDKGEIASARAFLTLASTLGNADAHIALARIYEEEDNFEEAYELYALAYGKGVDSVLPNLAMLLMRTDRRLALEILKTNAQDGNIDCLRTLVAILTEEGEKGDKKELRFWKSRLDALEPKPLAGK